MARISKPPSKESVRPLGGSQCSIFGCLFGAASEELTTDHNENTPIRRWLAVTCNQLVIHYGWQLLQFLDNLGCPSELLALVGQQRVFSVQLCQPCPEQRKQNLNAYP